jgi:hypothetical protein
MEFYRTWFDTLDCERYGLECEKAIASKESYVGDFEIKEFKFNEEYLETKLTLSEEEKKKLDSKKALKFLADTDWYLIRELENGIKVPETIKRDRELARLKVIKNG